jgi:D-sedoheptulose 7-phosphate isomerase
VEAHGRPGDVLVLHSTSGDSPNVVRAAQSARARGVTVIAFLGRDGGRLKALADVALVIASDHTAHVQELHLALEHAICELVEERLRA